MDGNFATQLITQPKPKPVCLSLLCVCVFGPLAGSGSGGSAALNLMGLPYFEDISPRSVTAVIDEVAVLKCRVSNKGNRTVSTRAFFVVTLK